MDVKKIHIGDLFIAFVFFTFTSVGTLFRFIPQNGNVFQFIIESCGNIGGVIVASFLFFYLKKESNFKKREIIVLSVGFGLSIYEFIQIFIPWSTFDLNDLIGTLAGVVLASVINILTVLWFKQKEY